MGQFVGILWLVFSGLSVSQAIECEQGYVDVHGATPGICYILLPIEMGKRNFYDATNICFKNLRTLPHPQSVLELEALASWALEQGIPSSDEDPAGFWLGYVRSKLAPLQQPGNVYSPNVRSIRKDKSLFLTISSFVGSQVNRMPGKCDQAA